MTPQREMTDAELQRLSDELEHAEAELETTVLREQRAAWVKEEVRRRQVNATRPSVESLGRSAAALLAEEPADVDWLVPNLLGPGWLVKLAAREKTGKGVFCAYLLGCLERGEPTVFGPSATATALIFTEEPPAAIRQKIADAGLRRATVVSGWELAGLSWEVTTDALVDCAVHHGHRIIFIDNFARATGVTGGEENDNTLGRLASDLGEAAKKAGVAVLLNHHHKKGGPDTDVWDLSRGGTALPAACDVNVEMQEVGDSQDRRRRLSARGRIAETNWVLGVKLSDDRRTYAEVDVPDGANRRGNAAEEKSAIARMRLQQVGSTTAKEFALALGGDVTDKTAARRLDALERDGWARKDAESGKKSVWHYTDGPSGGDLPT